MKCFSILTILMVSVTLQNAAMNQDSQQAASSTQPAWQTVHNKKKSCHKTTPQRKPRSPETPKKKIQETAQSTISIDCSSDEKFPALPVFLSPVKKVAEQKIAEPGSVYHVWHWYRYGKIWCSVEWTWDETGTTLTKNVTMNKLWRPE